MSRIANPQRVLLLTAAALVAASFMRPAMQLERLTYRYIFVFDITQSMNVTDVPGAAGMPTRLEHLKQSVTRTLADLPCGTEAGLALFSGHRVFLLITPIEICANYRELTGIVGRIDWRMSWEARSEVAKGLYKGIELMSALGEDTRVVFMTDGHEAPPINPDVPPQFSGEKGAIGGVLVGVGGSKPVPIPKFDPSGERQGFWKADEVLHVDSFNAERVAREGGTGAVVGTEHLSSLREAYLEQLAGQTGLVYQRLDDAAELSRLLQSDTFGRPKIVTTDLRWLYALVALAALVGSLLIEPVQRWRGA